MYRGLHGPDPGLPTRPAHMLYNLPKNRGKLTDMDAMYIPRSKYRRTTLLDPQPAETWIYSLVLEARI